MTKTEELFEKAWAEYQQSRKADYPARAMFEAGFAAGMQQAKEAQQNDPFKNKTVRHQRAH